MTASLTNDEIGTKDFISISPFVPAKEQVQDITRPNTQGIAVQWLGKKGEPARYLAVRDLVAPDAAALELILDDYYKMQGQTVTFVDDYGISHGNVFIKVVDIPGRLGRRFNPAPVAGASGGFHGSTATHKIIVFLTMVDGGW